MIEEYTGAFSATPGPARLDDWPAELFLLVGRSRRELVAALDALAGGLPSAGTAPLRRLAASAWQTARAVLAKLDEQGLKLAVVATSADDLRDKLAAARAQLDEGAAAIDDPRGVYFAESPLTRGGSVAFLFPGQGSQYPGMLRELAIHFDEVRGCFEAASRLLAGRFPQPLGVYVFPPPWFSPEEERAREDALKQTNVAQPSLGAAGLGMFRLLAALGVEPGAVAGHSYGEYVALCAAGALAEEHLYDLSEVRGRVIIESAGPELGTMAAVRGRGEAVVAALEGAPEVWIANVNGPRQTVISGTRAGIEAAVQRLGAVGLSTRPVAVACAFHSPLIAEAAGRFSECLARAEFAPPRIPVFSNVTAAPHAAEAGPIARALSEHLTSPVRFMDEIEAMYAAGCRIFVEVGPRNILTGLVQQTLRGRRFLGVPIDVPGRSGLVQLLHVLGQLAAHGVGVSLDRVFEGRLASAEPPAPLSPTTWLVSGGQARPLNRKTASERASESAGEPIPATAAIRSET